MINNRSSSRILWVLALLAITALEARLAKAQVAPPVSSAATPPVMPAAPPSILVSPPIPDQRELFRMIWMTMATLDGANLTGNYSVLRDGAAQSFQTANDQSRLSSIFASLRASGVDFSTTLMMAPTLRSAPRLVQSGVLLVQGSFDMRPAAVQFEFLYQWTGGRWRLLGLSVVPQSALLPATAPRPTPPPPAVPVKSR